MHGLRNNNVSGDYVYNAKNAHGMHATWFIEDGKYCQKISMKPVKDVYDYTEWGDGAERIYECITTGQGSANMRFCWACWMTGSMDVEYSMYTRGSQNMFACVGMIKKAVLHTQQTVQRRGI